MSSYLFPLGISFLQSLLGMHLWSHQTYLKRDFLNVFLKRIFLKVYFLKKVTRVTNLKLGSIKNIRELSWMSHRVMRFWFLLNFLFISAFFDILASLSISRVFSSGFSGRPKSSCLDIPRTIIKCDYIN